jgi:hypothetical protein
MAKKERGSGKAAPSLVIDLVNGPQFDAVDVLNFGNASEVRAVLADVASAIRGDTPPRYMLAERRWLAERLQMIAEGTAPNDALRLGRVSRAVGVRPKAARADTLARARIVDDLIRQGCTVENAHTLAASLNLSTGELSRFADGDALRLLIVKVKKAKRVSAS